MTSTETFAIAATSVIVLITIWAWLDYREGGMVSHGAWLFNCVAFTVMSVLLVGFNALHFVFGFS